MLSKGLKGMGRSRAQLFRFSELEYSSKVVKDCFGDDTNRNGICEGGDNALDIWFGRRELWFVQKEWDSLLEMLD